MKSGPVGERRRARPPSPIFEDLNAGGMLRHVGRDLVGEAHVDPQRALPHLVPDDRVVGAARSGQVDGTEEAPLDELRAAEVQAEALLVREDGLELGVVGLGEEVPRRAMSAGGKNRICPEMWPVCGVGRQKREVPHQPRGNGALSLAARKGIAGHCEVGRPNNTVFVQVMRRGVGGSSPYPLLNQPGAGHEGGWRTGINHEGGHGRRRNAGCLRHHAQRKRTD